MKAVILVRVSTGHQAQAGHGLSAQLDACQKFAADQGYAETVVIEEEGVSGGLDLDKRPALLEAISQLRKGDALVVYRHDRLSRQAMTQAIVERLVQKKGARILSASGVGNENTPEASLMKSIVQAFAIYERSLAKVRTKAASQAIRKQGKQFSRFAPLGFQYVDGCLVEDAKEQDLIKFARSLRQEGNSWDATTTMVFDAGFTNRQGGKFSRQHLYKALKKAA